MWRVAVSFAVAASWVLCSLAPAEAKPLPKNSKIAFNRNGALYTVEPDGSNLSQLINSSFYPNWSPDGTEIVVAEPGEGNISVVSADGLNVRNLSKNRTAYGSYPTWSPDGTKLAFSSGEFPHDTHDIYIMDSEALT